jgi:hypothetical protein
MILDSNKIFFSDSLASGASGTHVIDLAKVASSLNRKHVPSVDRNGNAQMFVVKVSSNGTDSLTRHLRPFLDVNHENATTTEIDTETSGSGGLVFNTHFQGDEYTRTRLAVSTPIESTELAGTQEFGDDVDTYSLTLCDASVTEDVTADSPDESTGLSDQDSYVSVGMIAEWLSSIKKKAIGNADVLSIQADNALLQLVADSASSEEVLELAEDAAQEGRPWDLDGSAYTALTGAAYYRSSANQSRDNIIFVPCGILQIVQANGHSATETITTEFEILDIYDM